MEERPADYFAPERWRENEDYLFGVDLYNHGYLWEAHEAWEGLWHRAKHDTVQALYLQGLIQCAAASLKIPMGQPRGLERLTSLGTEKLERALAEPAPDSVRPGYMGLDVAAFVESMREFAASSPATNEARPRLELE